MNEDKRGILVVSFGTSQNDTCKKTLGAIEHEIRKAYSAYPVYRAWTSAKIRKKVQKQEGISIYSVSEALEVMKKEGLQEIIVQPTYVLNGIEYERMKAELQSAQQVNGSIDKQEALTAPKIAVGAPLLNTSEDCERIASMLIDEWQIKEDEMLIFMGHGTEHASDGIYAALNDLLWAKGGTNRMIGTVQGGLNITELTKKVQDVQPQRIILVPFMIAAGVHAVHDMAGEQADSWKRILEKEGYEVTCVLKGLGEYRTVRQMFLEHLNAAMQSLQE